MILNGTVVDCNISTGSRGSAWKDCRSSYALPPPPPPPVVYSFVSCCPGFEVIKGKLAKSTRRQDGGAHRSKKLFDQWWGVNLSTGELRQVLSSPFRLLVLMFFSRPTYWEERRANGNYWKKQAAGRSLVRPPVEVFLSVTLRKCYSNVHRYLPFSTLLRSAVFLLFMVVCHSIQFTKRKWKGFQERSLEA